MRRKAKERGKGRWSKSCLPDGMSSCPKKTRALLPPFGGISIPVVGPMQFAHSFQDPSDLERVLVSRNG